jgi:hypothetical protein
MIWPRSFMVIAVAAAQRLLVRFDHVASFIVSANHSAM